ncbi:hypothetical protein CANCADRAFT_2703 [Tortispora caseinolytica NRRL Y-17796]|uniref:Uncharacterized protein n=1 Tax=Tortispora caseinolytica NRRL Y-17796 TaxID=767744 RepID=A0A1E4TGU2_9ASCO|nr:hypothetical protein CANCADRAFT_2703 [Tortispora caseinolytica NRRL Y-17796]
MTARVWIGIGSFAIGASIVAYDRNLAKRFPAQTPPLGMQCNMIAIRPPKESTYIDELICFSEELGSPSMDLVLDAFKRSTYYKFEKFIGAKLLRMSPSSQAPVDFYNYSVTSDQPLEPDAIYSIKRQLPNSVLLRWELPYTLTRMSEIGANRLMCPWRLMNGGWLEFNRVGETLLMVFGFEYNLSGGDSKRIPDFLRPVRLFFARFLFASLLAQLRAIPSHPSMNDLPSLNLPTPSSGE